MKKTRLIEIINIIRDSWVSYISILLFVTLGVAVFTGIGWSGEAFIQSINQEFREYQFHDFELLYPYGMSDNDLAEIKNISDVSSIQGVYSSYQFFYNNGSKTQAKVVMITDESDSLSQIEGKVPTKKNEIALEKNWAINNNVDIGDKISFVPDGNENDYFLHNLLNAKYENLNVKDSNSNMKYLNCKDFVVTALAESPTYMSAFSATYGSAPQNSTPINCVMFANKNAFDSKAFSGYSGAIIRSNALNKYVAGSDEYEDCANRIKNNIAKVTDGISAKRNGEIEKAKQDCINYFETKISDAENKIANAERTVSSKKSELSNAKNTISQSEAKLKTAKSKLNNAKVQLNQLATEIKTAKKQLSEQIGKLTPAQIRQAQEYISSLEDTYNLKSTDYNKAQAEYNTKLKKLNDVRNKLKNAAIAISNSEKEIQQNKIELSSAKNDIDELKESLNKIESYDIRVLTRDENAGSAAAMVVADMYSTLKYNMAAMFVLIGLLVCYSAVARIVYKHRKLIGTKKALGFRKREIAATYLSYAGSSAIIGTILGLLVGRFIVEPMFLKINKESYLIESTQYHFSWKEAAILFALEVGLSLIAAFIACRKMLKKNAVELISGEEDNNGRNRFYENSRIWNRTSLFGKTIVNNFFNNTTRVVAMIIGTMGCTALIVCGVFFSNIIDESFNRQYDKIQNFDTVVVYDNSVDGCKEKIKRELDKETIRNTPVYYSMGLLEENNKKSSTTYLFAFENNDTKELMNLYSLDGKRREIGDKVWISCAYTDEYNLNEGDSLKYIDLDSKENELEIGGIHEYYLMHAQLVMTQDTYEKEFGKKIDSNAFMINKNNVNLEKLTERLEKIDGFIVADDFYIRSKDSFDAVNNVCRAVAALFIVFSLLTALLIQLNLLIMFVEEKKRELITLMINGYSLKEAKRYIYSDTIVVTIIGMILGVVIGIFMGQWNVDSMTSDLSYFIQDLDIISPLVGVASTSLFTLFMTIIALRRIPKFELSDISRE